ncbi:hypothetical protein UFOVP1596_25 [uncultured Caudovirales phage]|uniref:Uncharacterized protein n=1 Tax=uncultured Caudovirales phage TaxID=2100421 RepID=A0A6J5SUS1_9CAUD|nr:hypothetical protein UFOVP1596_25 [uncultured Caudovirales phage]
MENNESALALLTQPETAEAAMQSIPGLMPVLERNRSGRDKMKAGGTALLEKAAAGMNDEIDTAMNDFLVNVRKGKDAQMERRAPLTKFFDLVRSQFTETEKDFDTTNALTVPAQVLKKRNEYASFKIEEKKKADALTKLKTDQANERISLKADIQRKFNEYSNNYQLSKIRDLTSIFESTTLDFINRAHLPIQEFPEHPSKTKDFAFSYTVRPVYIPMDEAGDIMEKEISSLKITFGRTFMDAMKTKKQELIDKIPGKKKELEEIAAAEAASKAAAEAAAKAKSAEDKKAAEEATAKAAAEEKRLAEEAEARRLADEQASAAKAAAEKEQAEQQISSTAAAEGAVQSFDIQMEGEMVGPSKSAGSVKEAVKITVLQPAGWMLIFQYWFKNEGASLSVDDIGKKKMESMMTFCEKNVDKYGKIESDLISYGTEIKTSARK